MAYISHELRTPLNTVFAGMKLALKPYQQTDLNSELHSLVQSEEQEKKRTEQKDILQEISLACTVALGILNDFLMFDKLEQNTLAVNKQECGVIDFMSNAIKAILVQIREKRIHLTLSNYLWNDLYFMDASHTTEMFQVDETVDMATHMCVSTSGLTSYDSPVYIQAADMVNIDKHKLNQVIRNLLSNAIKFTPVEGDITVSISFEQLPKDVQQSRSDSEKAAAANKKGPTTQRGCLLIKVADTGAGISTVDQGRLFKEVVQFRPHELQEGGGSGLGLMITKGIVECHQGSIEVYSAGEGTGSMFSVRLPMTRIIPSPQSDKDATSKDSSLDNLHHRSQSAHRRPLCPAPIST